MKKTVKCLSVLLLAALFLPLCGCVGDVSLRESGDSWNMGFGSCEMVLPENTENPLYIAGYHNGTEITGVLDLQRANAVWMDVGGRGLLFIGIDCVALSGAAADEIRSALSEFCQKTGCAYVNVFSTHDHAGVDTLGLWGPVAMEGKNPEFDDNLTAAAVSAAEAAYAGRTGGRLYYSEAVTENMQRDSRDPQVYDRTLYQFRFAPDAGSGIRIIIYSAHAESLRGDNTLVSRDYPGVISDVIKEQRGDDVLFMPGAVGGLIMTSVQTDGDFDAVSNMKLTGERLAEYAMSADTGEKELPAQLKFTRKDFDVPLDNTLFMYYRFLGILGNRMKTGKSGTGYVLRTSLSVLSLGDKTVAMLPGEIFPELVSGDGLKAEDPEALGAIAASYGIDGLIVTGLCNDEIGYITVPSDYYTDPLLPFIREGTDESGIKHYEETNSAGRDAAFRVAGAFRDALAEHCG